MEKNLCLIIAAILLTSCAVVTEQPGKQDFDNPQKSTEIKPQASPDPEVVIQDELLNEPPDNPRFVIAQAPAGEPAENPVSERSITQAIKRNLQRVGYVEADSRDKANVVVWYSYDSKQTGLRKVGEPGDVWGEQLSPLTISDLDSVKPVSFTVQIVSLQESRFPHQVIPIWRGEWSSSLPGESLLSVTNDGLVRVFNQYLSEQTRSQIAAFREARERKLQRAMNTYMAMVMYRIQKNWQKPKRNVKGKTCKVKIVQSAVGEIRSHKLLNCDKDWRFRRSIEKAIKQSSPLPMPKEDLFDRSELILIFQG